jgi:hypothetical protein
MTRYSAPRYPDMANKRFGRLFVVGVSRTTPDHRVYWSCWCDCGKEKEVRADSLRSGAIQSCGCLGIERRSAATAAVCTTHGLLRNIDGAGKQVPPEYRAWTAAKQRCFNAGHPRYPDWGGRGIRMCEAWTNSFEAFFADMGRRPSEKHSLDRIDVNGHYEPGNCRWADAATQRANRRDSAKAAT